MELSNIYAPVDAELSRVKDELKSLSRVDFAWLADQLTHVVKGSGKGIRPALTLLSGKLYDYNLKYLLPMAASVELMHTATLVHDDAIDKSDVRRGLPTINKIWGEETAILLGDYLFAKAGEHVADTENPHVIKLFSQTLATISSGEINQFRSAYKLEQAWEDYLFRISSKTASLFRLATETGAILSGAPPEAVRLLREFGFNLGIAFQIVDDILDFTGSADTLGKPTGSDLAQGTLTLPAILLLKRQPENNPVVKLFKNKNAMTARARKAAIKEAFTAVRESPIVEECYQKAAEYCTKARGNLESLPRNRSRESLTALTEYILIRNL